MVEAGVLTRKDHPGTFSLSYMSQIYALLIKSTNPALQQVDSITFSDRLRIHPINGVNSPTILLVGVAE